MKLLSSRTGPDWIPLEAGEPAEGARDNEFSLARERLTADLTSVLMSEHLVVLSGLGTSLCVTDAEGRRRAPTMRDLWGSVREETGELFERVVTKVRYPAASGENIELLLSHCQLSQLLEHDEAVAHFVAIAEGMVVTACDFLEDGERLPVHEMFLRKCARRSTRLSRAKIFTTNYDLCFENAASQTRFVVIDGFSPSLPQMFDGSYFSYDIVRRGMEGGVPDYIQSVFHLYKLHGSLQWESRAGEVVKCPNPERPLLVYPQYGKFEASYTQPFIELMSRFQFELRQQNLGVIVVGCGFNDFHISQPLMSAVRSNVSARFVVVDPSLDQTENSCVAELAALVRGGDSRVSLLAGTFEDLAALLPDLIAPTEGERHVDRVQTTRAR